MGMLGEDESMLATAVSPLNGSKKTTLALTAHEMPVPDNRSWMLAGEASESLERKDGCSFTSSTAVEMERRGGVKATETWMLPGETVTDREGAGTTTRHKRINMKAPVPE